jgi:hypothetical protein
MVFAESLLFCILTAALGRRGMVAIYFKSKSLSADMLFSLPTQQTCSDAEDKKKEGEKIRQPRTRWLDINQTTKLLKPEVLYLEIKFLPHTTNTASPLKRPVGSV